MPRRKISVAPVKRGCHIAYLPRARKPEGKQVNISSAMPRDVNTPVLESAMSRADAEEIAMESVRPDMATRGGRSGAMFDTDLTASFMTALEPARREKNNLILSLHQITQQLTMIKTKRLQRKIALSDERYMTELRRGLEAQEDVMLRLFKLYSRLESLNNLAANLVSGPDPRSTTFRRGYVVDALNSFPSRDASFRNNMMLWRAEKQLIPFLHQVIDAYGCLCDAREEYVRNGINRVPEYFCLISGRAAWMLYTTVFHFVDDRLGVKAAEAIFGPGTEHIWNTANSLPIEPIFQDLLNEGKAIILPTMYDSLGKVEFAFFPLHRDFCAGKPEDLEYDEMFYRTLKFPNDARPHDRYVMFRAVMTLLRASRNDKDEYEHRLEVEVYKIPNWLWKMPGPPLKNAILYKVSRDVGCMTPAAANRFWDLGRDERPPSESLSQQDARDADALALQVCAAVLQLGTPQAEFNGLEEEGDDDEIFGEDEEGVDEVSEYTREGLSEWGAAALDELEDDERIGTEYEEAARNERYRRLPPRWMARVAE